MNYLTVETAGREAAEPTEQSNLFDYVELLLKNRARLSEVLRRGDRLMEVLPNLLGIALVGFAAYAAIIWAVFNLGGAEAAGLPKFSLASLTLSYTAGLVASVGVCLPSFYFYALLAGVKASMVQIAAQAVRALAVTAILLLGIMPVYLAVVVGLHIGGDIWRPGYELSIRVGLVLPFLAGFFGVSAFYRGFADLAYTFPPHRRRTRGRFLRLMALAQSGLYAFVSPFMIHTLLKALDRIF
ncbi:MAG TPA: hypothetical protein VJH03_20480 [Blastocatellia bacterium]|nr:hypothetical protein [Blastocatellia bacterium]